MKRDRYHDQYFSDEGQLKHKKIERILRLTEYDNSVNSPIISKRNCLSLSHGLAKK